MTARTFLITKLFDALHTSYKTRVMICSSLLLGGHFDSSSFQGEKKDVIALS